MKKKKSKRKTVWRIWPKALGEKGSHCDRESDIITIVRSFIFLTYLITNLAIVFGVVRYWNNTKNCGILDTEVLQNYRENIS